MNNSIILIILMLGTSFQCNKCIHDSNEAGMLDSLNLEPIRNFADTLIAKTSVIQFTQVEKSLNYYSARNEELNIYVYSQEGLIDTFDISVKGIKIQFAPHLYDSTIDMDLYSTEVYRSDSNYIIKMLSKDSSNLVMWLFNENEVYDKVENRSVLNNYLKD